MYLTFDKILSHNFKSFFLLWNERVEHLPPRLNGQNDYYKRQFSALAAHSQSWKLDNLSKYDRLFFFLVNWLVLQAAYYNLTENFFAQIISVKLTAINIFFVKSRQVFFLINFKSVFLLSIKAVSFFLSNSRQFFLSSN